MINVTFIEFRKDASALFSVVEKGEVIQVTRHGKPIAKITPLMDVTHKLPSWKKKIMKTTIKGEALSVMIEGEREAE